MIWREVARSYADAFEKAVSEYSSQAKTTVQSLAATESAVLPEIRLDHLKTLTDDTGIFQHALYTVPDRTHGYCTDDNARALLVTVMNWRLFKEESILPLFRTYLSFLLYAYNERRGRMRNFMSYQRHWQEEIGSEDSHGRSIWALGYTVAYPPDDSLIGLVTRLFKQCLLQAPSFTSPRAWAFTAIGLTYYLRRFGGDPEARRLLEELSRRLHRQFADYATAEWFWLEEIVTYDNARIPQALIAAGSCLHDEKDPANGLGASTGSSPSRLIPAGGSSRWWETRVVPPRRAESPL